MRWRAGRPMCAEAMTWEVAVVVVVVVVCVAVCVVIGTRG